MTRGSRYTAFALRLFSRRDRGGSASAATCSKNVKRSFIRAFLVIISVLKAVAHHVDSVPSSV